MALRHQSKVVATNIEHEEYPNKLTAQSKRFLIPNQVDFQARQIKPLFFNNSKDI